MTVNPPFVATSTAGAADTMAAAAEATTNFMREGMMKVIEEGRRLVAAVKELKRMRRRKGQELEMLADEEKKR